MISVLRLTIKDELTKSMRYELDDHPEDFISLIYEYLCDLLSTIKVKYEIKIAAVQIKNIASARSESLSDSDKSVSITKRKMAKTDVFYSNKYPRRAQNRHHSVQRYCVLYKKSGIPERNYMPHSAEDCTGLRTNRPISNRTNSVKQYNKSEKNGRRSWNLSRI